MQSWDLSEYRQLHLFLCHNYWQLPLTKCNVIKLAWTDIGTSRKSLVIYKLYTILISYINSCPLFFPFFFLLVWPSSACKISRVSGFRFLNFLKHYTITGRQETVDVPFHLRFCCSTYLSLSISRYTQHFLFVHIFLLKLSSFQ